MVSFEQLGPEHQTILYQENIKVGVSENRNNYQMSQQLILKDQIGKNS